METPEKTNEQTKKKCFVIMPISDVDGYSKGHFNRVYDYIIVPACKQEGYEPIRADATSKSNVIIVDILPQFGIRIVHKKVGSLTNILYLYR